jgi:hypothetical protein
MTWRQHSGTKPFIRRGKPARRRQSMLRGRGPVWAAWLMGGLRRAETMQTADGIAVTIGNDVVVRLPGEEFTLFAPKPPLMLEA